jgi:hypothetical protein
LNQLEPCYQAFVQALQIAESGQRPAFMRETRTPGYYTSLSQADPDLALLRADSRYQTAISRFQGSAPAPL